MTLAVLLAFLLGSAPAPPEREVLVPFDGRSGVGLAPEMLFGKDRGEYSLLYDVSADGSSIRTRFLGPSEALGAGLWTEARVEGDEHVLVCGIGRSDFQVTLARWRLDALGKIRDARVRTEPVVEVRTWRDIEHGELVAPCEWRPWIDGRGVGDWRR